MEITLLNILLVIVGLHQLVTATVFFIPEKQYQKFFAVSLDTKVGKLIFLQWAGLISTMGLLALYMGISNHIFIPLIIGIIIIKLIFSVSIFIYWKHIASPSGRYLIGVVDFVLVILLIIALIR